MNAVTNSTNSRSGEQKGDHAMNTIDPPEKPIVQQRKSGRWRRVRVLWRLALRKLFRAELVEMDSNGNPKVNPIRWL